jgi:uncharacterized membrane protein
MRTLKKMLLGFPAVFFGLFTLNMTDSVTADSASIHFIDPPEKYAGIEGAALMSRNGQAVTGVAGPALEPNLSNYVIFRWTQQTGTQVLDSSAFVPNFNNHFSVYAISGDGTRIGGQIVPPSGQSVQFRWTESNGFVEFPVDIRALSKTGQISAGHLTGCGIENPFRYTNQGGVECIGTLLDSSFVEAISGDGNTIVGRSLDHKSEWGEAFLWTAATGTLGLGDLPGGSKGSTAFGVTNDGSVVVGMTDISDAFPWNKAFRWTAEAGLVPIDNMFAAFNVSNDGSVITGNGHDGRHLWTECLQATHLQSLLENVFGLDFRMWELNSVWSLSGNGRTMLVRLNHSADQRWAVITIPFVPTSTCVADLHPTSCGDRMIDVEDLLAVINNWGPCEVIEGQRCPGDVVIDEHINVDDLLGVINAWGECD